MSGFIERELFNPDAAPGRVGETSEAGAQQTQMPANECSLSFLNQPVDLGARMPCLAHSPTGLTARLCHASDLHHGGRVRGRRRPWR